MTKSQFVSALAKKGYKKKEAEKIISDVFDTITETLAKGEKVSITNFGVFEVKQRAQKKVLNPQTKEPVVVEPRMAAVFRAGSELKQKVANIK